MSAKAGSSPVGDLHEKNPAARSSLRRACRRLALSCARDAWDNIRCIPAIPYTLRDIAREAAHDTRHNPHRAVVHLNGVPFGAEGVSWAIGSGTGLLVPGAAAALFAAEAVFLLACPRHHARVILWAGRRDRAAAEAVVAGYEPCGRQGIPPSGHLEAGLCLAWLGRHADALGAYARAGGAEPAGLLPFLRGASLAHLNRHSEACKEYAEALLLEPGLGMARATLRVSRAIPDGNAGDPDGLALGVCLVMGGGKCAQCGRPARSRGHVRLDRPGAEPWYLCHMRGRRWNVGHVTGRVALLAVSLAALPALILLPVDHDLAVWVGLSRMLLHRMFG